MAEAVVAVVIENLNSFIQKELVQFLGVDREMDRLSSILSRIKAVLQDAEEKQLKDQALKDWLKKLEDAAHRLEDILDECSTKALALEYQGHKCRSADKVHCSCLYSFHPSNVLFRCKIAKKMEEISEKLNHITDERSKFDLCENDNVRRDEIKEWRQTFSVIAEPQVYGRDEEKEKIVSILVGEASNSEDVSVYSILGMGGLGKTTLAQLVFNDERIVNHFEPKIWVCVSDDFSLKRMLKAIIESKCGQACEDLDPEPLQRRLQELLGEKRYLLVLDDVWNDDQDKWDKLKYSLACGSKGASILVTTRLPNVGSIMGARSSHQLSMLSDDNCWHLFKQRAFGPHNEKRAELVAKGKEIVRKCKGVPLAAKTLGSLLRFKTEEKDWFKILENEIWNLPQTESSILPALRLSYLNLPAKLRQCFAFLALFSKDERMSKHLVIQLWMSNGFISSNEDDGDEVWRELYFRSFFEDVEDDGNDTEFKMHDLLHDLAQSVVGEECCCTTDELSQRTRHLFYGEFGSLDLQKAKFLRTLLGIWRIDANLSHDILKKCCFLRVLQMQGLKEVPSSIGHVKHLRYLDLSNGNFKTLPNSICSL